MGKSDWDLTFARPRIRWLSLMVARLVTILALVGAVVICGDVEAPGALVAFLLCVLAILFLEAVACEHRRSGTKGHPEIGEHPMHRRRETDP
jgi:heme A synthase